MEKAYYLFSIILDTILAILFEFEAYQNYTTNEPVFLKIFVGILWFICAIINTICYIQVRKQ